MSYEQPDYYDLLQIPRTATVDDIRKAYRKLAVKYHPDKNSEEDREEASERFKQIAAAYEILSDPDKRAMFDRYGHVDEDAAYSRGSDDRGFKHAQDIFTHFFRDFGGDSGGFGRSSFFDDPFFGGRHGGSKGFGRERNGSNGGFHSSFMDDGDDDFFGGRGGFGFGGFGGFSRHFAAMDQMFDDMHSSSFGSSSSGGTLRDGVSRSTSTTTRIENGKKITKTTTTVRHGDGRVETRTNEEIEDAPSSSKRYIEIGRGRDEPKRYLEAGRKSDRRVSGTSLSDDQGRKFEGYTSRVRK